MAMSGQVSSIAAAWLPHASLRWLRIAFGVLFLWLGLLKVIPGMSPAEGLMRASMPPFVPIDAFIRFAAVWEIVIGVGFLTGHLRRLVVLMTFATMAVTLSILWMAPDRLWTAFPFRLSFEGEYVVKDLVIVAAAIVLAVATVEERPALEGRFADAARRWVPEWVDRYLRFEARAAAILAPRSLPLLRLGLSVVFVWFGLINVLDPLGSPTWPMVDAAFADQSGVVQFRILGAIEVVAGVGIVIPPLERLAVALLLVVLASTAAFFVLTPELMFQQPPFVLTLEGQFVLKNGILATAAIVLVRARRAGREVAQPVLARV
jgi:uncharacterized membrane protein YkgB